MWQYFPSIAEFDASLYARGDPMAVSPTHSVGKIRYRVQVWRHQAAFGPPANSVVGRHALALAHLIAHSISSLAVQVHEQKSHYGSIEAITVPIEQTSGCIEKSQYSRGPSQLLKFICSDPLVWTDRSRDFIN
jgi:hypothetical protein